ncbi:MAG TPA: glycosyltransferase family 4 protein [Selenomonadales bacterium]|nr:glycosyltransferase family 4 protein [Selenomonadales bacterium]
MDLVLFLTRGMSIKKWDDLGMLSREISLYQELQSKGVRISFISFGNAEDLRYQNQLNGIRIYCNRYNLPGKIYEKLLPILHRHTFSACSLIKTNQMNGADLALTASLFFKKPLVARCGYMWSEFAAKQCGSMSELHQHTLEVEKKVFSKASRVVVTTPTMKEDILLRGITVAEKIKIIPNYVLTNVFRLENKEKDIDVLYIGRLAEQKNVQALLQAAQTMDIRLTIIGQGPLKEELQAKYGRSNIVWIDHVANTEIPQYVNRAKIFVLPSFYEGHPKTLIEAMACGAPVIGADSPGIREVIRHKETGLLCGTDPQGIAAAIHELLADTALCGRLGQAAREYAEKEYALDAIVEKEYEVYKQTLQEFYGERMP